MKNPFLFTLFMFLNYMAVPQMEWQNPLPQGNALRSVLQCLGWLGCRRLWHHSAYHGSILARYDSIYVTDDGGTAWEALPMTHLSFVEMEDL